MKNKIDDIEVVDEVGRKFGRCSRNVSLLALDSGVCKPRLVRGGGSFVCKILLN